jgi:polysaccharide export outer membrane protein
MKLPKITNIILFALFTSPFSYAQVIDPSMLENLSPEQVEMAKSEIAKSLVVTENEPKPITESTKKVDSTNDVNDFNNKKYGYNYFLTIPTTISALGDLPLPNDYKISLNDQFSVILSGSKEAIFDLNVNLDGTILFPELGSISVVGETFQDIKNKLRNLIEQSYIGVQVDLSLKNLSAKKITIVGAVNNPGTYLVNPFSTISSALSYSGGISEIGTLRNIRLIRANGENYNFDLYKLLINGDRSDDITIESGDVIVIGAADQFITLSGEIKRPAIYEIKNNETLNELVEFGLGFTQTANKTNINLSVLDKKLSIIHNKNVDNLSSDLENVINVHVNPYINKNKASIRVAGSVKEPGLYNIGDNNSLADFINELEFVDVYPWLAVLTQFDEDNLVKTTTLFSLKDPDTYNSIKLLPNSNLFFANINSRKFEIDSMTDELIRQYELKINHKQGRFNLPVIGKYKVSSFVDLLGLDMSDVENDATYISPLENMVIVGDYKNMQFLASKYSNITFKFPVNDLISVSIAGAIDFPGTYTLKPDSTLQDLYNLVGNFKKDAFLPGIIFSRESVRERQIESINKSKEDLNKALLTSSQKGELLGDLNVIQALSQTINPKYLGRISGNYSPESISSKNTILFDGDEIFIPRTPNTISVLGEVLNPIAFEYNRNIDIISAVNNAGGYQDYADKGKVYVIKANGMVVRNSRNIFVKNIKLEAGDTIIVPRKIITDNRTLASLIPITQVLSNIAFSAAALENLSNTN